jgi:cyclopropane fatty-acyl-phospholipid synthase-like methyltransferase
MFTNKDISDYYDLSEVHYRLFWNLDKSHSLHYGYWNSSTKNLHEALLNLNRILADIAEIKEGEKILDAGCGVGGSSVWLAREKKCFVTGISLNVRQIKKANLLTEKSGLAGKVFFEQKDYNNTSYPNNSFDVVWGIESVCYADDKSKFLKEAYRILKPGGRLIIGDFFKKEKLEDKEARLVQKMAHGWAINDFASIEEFCNQAAQAGFKKIKTEDISKAIMPSAKKLYRAYFLGIVPAKFYQLFHANTSTLGKNNVANAYLQYKTLKKGLWEYQTVSAVKLSN